MENHKIVVYTDGGSRGNPGPAAIGVVINLPGGQQKTYGENLGVKTNNEAEYQAVIFALKKLKQLLGKKKSKETNVEIRTDSELIARQLGALYKIKEDRLKILFADIWNLKMDFGEVKLVAMPREENRLADRLVNEALDKHV